MGIFGCTDARAAAEYKLQQRIDQKLTEGWVYEDNNSGRGYESENKGGWSKGCGKKGAKGHDTINATTATPGVVGAGPQEDEVSDDDGAAWGNWGGASGDEEDDANGGGGLSSAASISPAVAYANAQAARQLLGTGGKWSENRQPVVRGGSGAPISSAAFKPSEE